MDQNETIKIHCSFDELLKPSQIKPNKNNRNKHPAHQIDALAKIIKYQGIRHPLIISKNSGLLVAGHGRLAALKKLKVKEIPVKYQEFENEDQEYSFGISDNSIAAWAELDFSGINLDLENLGPDFDLDMLGLKDFKLDVSEKEDKEPEVESFNEKIITCPHCDQSFVMPKGDK